MATSFDAGLAPGAAPLKNSANPSAGIEAARQSAQLTKERKTSPSYDYTPPMAQDWAKQQPVNYTKNANHYVERYGLIWGFVIATSLAIGDPLTSEPENV